MRLFDYHVTSKVLILILSCSDREWIFVTSLFYSYYSRNYFARLQFLIFSAMDRMSFTSLVSKIASSRLNFTRNLDLSLTSFRLAVRETHL